MILRKPYAFLIKRFKLIHLIIGFIMLYLALKTKNIHNILNNCVNNSTSIFLKTENYINSNIYFCFFLLLVFIAIIYWLMIKKKKPIKLYLITIIGYFIAFIILLYIESELRVLEIQILEQKRIRLVRDLSSFILYFQYLMTTIMLIRGMGFDIKKFNFTKDIAELNIEDVDSEEFEVTLGDQKNKLVNFLRRTRRRLNYTFKENKIIILITLFIVLVVIGNNIYVNNFKYNQKYFENQIVETDYYQLLINNSYYVTKTYDNKIINNDKYYVIINFSVNSTLKKTFDVNKIVLNVNNKSYYSSLKYCDKFLDLGSCYKDNVLTNNNNNYILVYEMSQDIPLTSDPKLIYYDTTVRKNGRTYNKNIYLTINNLEREISTNEYYLNDTILFDKYILDHTKLTINNYEIKDYYTYQYHYCISNKCEKLANTILPSTKTQKPSVVMKLTYDLENNKISEVLKYATIYYQLANKQYKSNIYVLNTSASSKEVYIQVNKEVATADNIYLEFLQRNNKYQYYLKKS